jgi:flagellar basal body-associated protein FliL
MKTKIAVIVVIVILALLIVLQVALLGCKPDGETKEKAKEVKIETRSNYVFKKIYVKDKLGYTHEILTASSGNTLGGVNMLELCVYKEN